MKISIMKQKYFLLFILYVCAMSLCAPAGAQELHNIAKGRVAYQSSSYDHNLTSQLLTDGIVSKGEPAYLEVLTPQGMLGQRERESSIDGNEWTRVEVLSQTRPKGKGELAFLQYNWHGMTVMADEVQLVSQVARQASSNAPEGETERGFLLRVLTSRDGKSWRKVGVLKGDTLPLRHLTHTFKFKNKKPFRHLRLELETKEKVQWTLTEVKFRHAGVPVINEVLPSSHFYSAWMSEGTDEEWVYVDLGARQQVKHVDLHWIWKPASYQLQCSDDAQIWKRFQTGDSCRYVRVLMEGGSHRCALSEIEVKSNTQESQHSSRNTLHSASNDWRLQRASEVEADGAVVSTASFDDSSWTPAIVPGTVLMSYVYAGALPDPNYDDNLSMISESFFNSNFWYRHTFQFPEEMQGKRVFLNFDGINWKANVWLNGQQVTRIEGAFRRSMTDVTAWLRPEGENVLAVEIEKCAHPGAVKLKNEQDTDYNGGILGADNPTFHATVGWDWISTIPGRNIGIWNDVYFSMADDVTLADPCVTTRLNIMEEEADTLATMTATVVATNHADHEVKGTLRGWIGDIEFQQTVTLAANSREEIVFDPQHFHQLREKLMYLWMPNGYGEPYLYDAGFEFLPSACRLNYKVGIRQVEYRDADRQLKIYVNGQRIVPYGGNWGFPEANLRYGKREYDIAVGYHRDMNMNMIRNWVGQTGDEEFYEACDSMGIMVWQDFWLANPSDGPDPYDEKMFIDNARDYVSRIRRHPSVVLYCGRNEGYPPKSLNDSLAAIVAEAYTPSILYDRILSPKEGSEGGLLYISSSADEGVSGHGPYWALSPQEYFSRQTGKLHSERGMPSVMNYESLQRMLRPEHLWPQNLYWGRHDYTMQGAQRGATFNELVCNRFGQPQNAEQFTAWAQWVNYDGYRAIFESGSRDRQGLLIWMSHPCWPSMVWQTYDYYFEPTAAYFGVKKACEPLHVQWNPLTNQVEVVNTGAGYCKAAVVAKVRDMNGKVLWEKQQTCATDNDTTVACFAVEVPPTVQGMYYLELAHHSSRNTYVCSTVPDNFQALHTLPKVKLDTRYELRGDTMIVTLENRTSVPALMIRLNLKDDDGRQILPVIYEDNYFHLMPGESRTIGIYAPSLSRSLEITGFNL